MMLYKYSPLNKYAKENLLESKLRYNTPEKFNDPFDSYPCYDEDDEANTWLRFGALWRHCRYFKRDNVQTHC